MSVNSLKKPAPATKSKKAADQSAVDAPGSSESSLQASPPARRKPGSGRRHSATIEQAFMHTYDTSGPRLSKSDRQKVALFEELSWERTPVLLSHSQWLLISHWGRIWKGLNDFDVGWRAEQIIHIHAQLDLLHNMLHSIGALTDHGLHRMRSAAAATVDCWLAHIVKNAGGNDIVLNVYAAPRAGDSASGHGMAVKIQ